MCIYNILSRVYYVGYSMLIILPLLLPFYCSGGDQLRFGRPPPTGSEDICTICTDRTVCTLCTVQYVQTLRYVQYVESMQNVMQYVQYV